MKKITKTYKRVRRPDNNELEFYGVVQVKYSDNTPDIAFRSGTYRPEIYMALNDAEKLHDDLIKEGRI